MDSDERINGRPPPRYTRFGAVLAGAIRRGSLRSGTVLLEGPLAQIFGSSRGPVREALARLHAGGLVSRFDGRGYIVGGAGAPVRRVELSAEMLAIDGASRPLRTPFAWERLYEAVERSIIHRSVFGRSRINELELARHFGVGRTVARDVLTRLQSLGMVTKDERQRWMIVPLDAARLVNLYEIRIQLEPAALRHAQPLLDRAEVQLMRGRLKRALAAYPRVGAATMDDLEFDLHVRCLAPCPNTDLLEALQRTRCVLTLSKHVLGVEMRMPRIDPFMAEHLAVLDAMLAGKGAGAERLLRRHLQLSCPKVTERLDLFRRSFIPPDTNYIGSAQSPDIDGEPHASSPRSRDVSRAG